MHPDPFRLPLRAPLPAGILEVTHQFLLLGVDRDGRLDVLLELANPVIDVAELSVSIRVGSAFTGLAIRL